MFSPLGPIKELKYYTRTINQWDNLPTFRSRLVANGAEFRECPSWMGKNTVDLTMVVEMMGKFSISSRVSPFCLLTWSALASVATAMDVPPPATFVLM